MVKVPAGFPKRVMTLGPLPSISAAYTIALNAGNGMTILAVRATPRLVEGTSPTLALAISDDGAALSGTQAVTTATAAGTNEKVFTSSNHIAKDSAIVVTLTPGGTDPVLTDTVVEIEYLEG